MSDVIHIDDIRVERALSRRNEKQTQCKHLNIIYCTKDITIECNDCDARIDPFRAFEMIVERQGKAWAAIRRRELEVDEATKGALHLIAARNVAKAWSSKNMVPICPHCSEAIFQTDGFGSSSVSREIAKRRAEIRKSKNDK